MTLLWQEPSGPRTEEFVPVVTVGPVLLCG